MTKATYEDDADTSPEAAMFVYLCWCKDWSLRLEDNNIFRIHSEEFNKDAAKDLEQRLAGIGWTIEAYEEDARMRDQHRKRNTP